MDTPGTLNIKRIQLRCIIRLFKILQDLCFHFFDKNIEINQTES
jgi:hypothetical protein